MSSPVHVKTVESEQQPLAVRSMFPPAAYCFVLEGLNYAVEKTHGAPTAAQEAVARYMTAESIDLQELWDRRQGGKLSPEVLRAIEEAGGLDRLNRHVSGQELCWALRDFAQKRWGFVAPAVLATWNITRSFDFGRLVFDLIEHGRLQKEPQDSLEDFKDVYDFRDAFDRPFRLDFDDPEPVAECRAHGKH